MDMIIIKNIISDAKDAVKSNSIRNKFFHGMRCYLSDIELYPHFYAISEEAKKCLEKVGVDYKDLKKKQVKGFSGNVKKALKEKGYKIDVEHLYPQKVITEEILELAEQKTITEEAVIKIMKKNKIALMTAEEHKRLNVQFREKRHDTKEILEAHNIRLVLY